MRGQERKTSGPGRNGTPAPLRFSTADLPAGERLARWQDVVARTLTGCTSAPLPDRDFRVDFQIAGGGGTRLACTRALGTRNHRTQSCLRDGDEDHVFFLQLHGEAAIDHNGHRTVIAPGDGVFCDFSRTLDSTWPDARVLLIRLERASLRGLAAGHAAGVHRARADPLMQLLRPYARAAWRDAMTAGAVAPIAERHLAELVGAVCAQDSDEALRRAKPAMGAARVAAMRETIVRRHADPCLTMREVAAAAGISERAGHLAFEGAELTFTDELHAVRLDHARQRLLDGARVIDTAFAIGFSDTSHFYRLFKRRYGLTPGEWRAANA